MRALVTEIQRQQLHRPHAVCSSAGPYDLNLRLDFVDIFQRFAVEPPLLSEGHNKMETQEIYISDRLKKDLKVNSPPEIGQGNQHHSPTPNHCNHICQQEVLEELIARAW